MTKQIIKLEIQSFTARKEILSYLALEGIKCWQEVNQEFIYSKPVFFVCFEIEKEEENEPGTFMKSSIKTDTSKSKEETEEHIVFTAPCPVCKEDTVQKIIRNATYCYKHSDFLNEPDEEE